MKALITDGTGNIELRNIAVPSIGEYDCLVKIKSCLFCNTTDRHIVENSFNFGITYPAVLGHESIGVVVETGRKVSNFTVGDLVARPYAVFPGAFTAEGLGSAWGGFAEYGMICDYDALASDKNIKNIPSFFLYMQKIPSGIPWQKAMMISCQKEIFSSAAQVDAVGKKILILGAGVAGCLFADFLKFRGAGEVVVAARRMEQLEFVQHNTSADQAKLFNELDEKFDYIVDTTGNLPVLEKLSAKHLDPGGTILSYAIYENMQDPFFVRNIAAGRFKRIDPKEYLAHKEICDMLKTDTIDCTPYITHEYSIDDFRQAWNSVCGKNTVKTAIVF